MQSIWPRVIQSRTTCRCVSCLSTTAEGVTSRSAGAASRRRLRICNSVTIFYSSIFAGAALADSTAKTQRRHDWEEKIAAVKAEVKELVDEEQRIVESLRSRNTNANGFSRLLQSRRPGTALNLPPTTRVTLSRPTRSFHTVSKLNSAENTANLPLDENRATEESKDYDLINEDDHDIFDEGSDGFQSFPFKALPGLINDTLRLKAIQKLALKQLAIRLVIRPAIAHRYSGLQMNYGVDFNLPPVRVEAPLYELRQLQKQIDNLKTNIDANPREVIPEITEAQLVEIQEKNRKLDIELAEDLGMYANKRISLQQALRRVSRNLVQSADPDRPAAFRHMLIIFTKTHQNDLNDLVLTSFLPNGFYLGTSLIVSIITFFRKSKNLKAFDLFLQMLSGDGYPINIGSGHYWEKHKINGLDIVVPNIHNQNPLVIGELIVTALRFDQPERADAWLQAARTVGFFDNFKTLHSYLRFYSIRQDWEKGVLVLKRAVTYLLSSVHHETEMVERLLLLMVYLCDSCNQEDVSKRLISAAMLSGFDQQIPVTANDLKSYVDPKLGRWTQAAQNVPEEKMDRPLWQKCFDFANAFSEELNGLELPNDGTLSQKRAILAARHAREAVFTAQHEINSNADSIMPEPQFETSSSSEKPMRSPQNDEFTALKDEVAQLRELVFELRKHQIEASFNDESNTDPGPSSHATNDIEVRSNPNTQDPSIKVEFERSTDPIDSAKHHKSVEIPERSPAARRKLFLRHKQNAALKKSMNPDPFAVPGYPALMDSSIESHEKGLQNGSEEQAEPFSHQSSSKS